MNIRDLLERGQQKQNEEHNEKEVAKRGILRGGSAGCIGTDGRVYGECHRVSLARLLGVDKEHEPNRHIMFDAGRTAEDSWAEKLGAAGVPFRREEEIQITWPVPGWEGRVVTGRPDIVIGSINDDQEREFTSNAYEPSKFIPSKFVPKFGLELKGVYSAGSAVRVECEGKPDPKHLAQAGFYSMALSIPYAICYTNPSVWDVPYWAKEARAAGHKKLQPFYRIFYMRWNDDSGLLEYRDERDDDHWITTVYTKIGIVNYYQTVLGLEQDKKLNNRPTGGMADGEAMPYDKCAYCPFSSACDMYDLDKNFDQWLENCSK